MAIIAATHFRLSAQSGLSSLQDPAAAKGKVSGFRTPGETGRWVKPVMTPDDPDQVMAELARHGVTVTRSQAG